jgi:hypothetical protein
MGWEGHVARMGEIRSTYRILIRKLEGERFRWGDDIKLGLREVFLGVD